MTTIYFRRETCYISCHEPPHPETTDFLPMPYLLLTLSALFWSGNFVLSRGVNALIPPVGFVFWRWVVALAVLLPFVVTRLRQEWPLVCGNLKLLALFGLLGVTLFNLFIYTAVHYTTAINAVLVNSVTPMLIILLARFCHGQPVTRLQGLGVTLSLIGVLTIMLQGDPAAVLQLSFNRGDVLVLAAALDWALYSLALRRYPEGLDPLVFLFVITLWGLLFLAPLYITEILSGRPVTFTPVTIASIAYTGVFASVAAFICWNSGIRRVGAHLGGQFIHLMPAFSAILAVLFLGERFRPFHLAGILLIVTGIICATIRNRAPAPSVNHS